MNRKFCPLAMGHNVWLRDWGGSSCADVSFPRMKIEARRAASQIRPTSLPVPVVMLINRDVCVCHTRGITALTSMQDAQCVELMLHILKAVLIFFFY
jgi:hypothetical protein